MKMRNLRESGAIFCQRSAGSTNALSARRDRRWRAHSLSAGLTGAVNGAWQVADADQASGILSFIADGEQWKTRRALARDFWTDAHAKAAAGADG